MRRIGDRNRSTALSDQHDEGVSGRLAHFTMEANLPPLRGQAFRPPPSRAGGGLTSAVAPSRCASPRSCCRSLIHAGLSVCCPRPVRWSPAKNFPCSPKANAGKRQVSPGPQAPLDQVFALLAFAVTATAARLRSEIGCCGAGLHAGACFGKARDTRHPVGQSRR